MKKSTAFLTVLVLISISIIGLIVIYGKEENTTSDQIKIGATIFPLYDIARNIAGDKIEVVNILPPGASPHTFEITPEKVKELQNTKVVFAIGQGLDDWMNDLTNSLTGIEIVMVSNNIALRKFSDEQGHDSEEQEGNHDEHGEYDPHYWLSINNAKIIAQNIANRLEILDPLNSSSYQKNLEDYQEKLDILKEESENKIRNLTNTALVTAHDAWSYFAEELNLKIVGSFQPSPGKEPTPQELSALQALIAEYKVKALFSEPQLSENVVKPFADDTGLEIFVLDPLGGVEDRQSYIDLIKYNVNTIYEALK
ncbi:MAG: hypothetical protein COT24_00785 [Candidatus Kerfeldbacteria bacterium CG08_land_8_20_14_0_20_40_16]|uniref:Zinc ABC transporter substrate-binding protein n=1 Tax=Candidatus Kerfeldbacteria bacterium CG08_land_8_20_14_0_20_40_16 TaxID=2014244 RepID=A0A2H0YWV4_9BACT|nr:MAG: hypothetical protein COT24_00785 [Candidatus Kerfeldbacteria bacterium CG08_land_8_20_14_0_20_40_16]